jgi:hypothetical protein
MVHRDSEVVLLQTLLPLFYEALTVYMKRLPYPRFGSSHLLRALVWLRKTVLLLVRDLKLRCPLTGPEQGLAPNLIITPHGN